MCDDNFPEDDSAIRREGVSSLFAFISLYTNFLNWEYGKNASSRVTNMELALFQATTLVSPNHQ